MRAEPIALALLCAAQARAAGFAVGEQGAAAFGLAGAATARPDLPEIGFYNPSAWSRRSGFSATLGATAVSAAIAHLEPGTRIRTDATIALQAPPYLYAGYGAGGWAGGLAVGVPFGSGLAWPRARWPGRFEVTAIALSTVEVAPSLAWQPVEWLSLAAGPRLLRGAVELSRQIDAVNSEASLTLAGSGWSAGGQAAVLYGPVGPVTLGLTWRSRAALEFEGVAHFQDVPPELSSKARDGAVTAAATLPDRVALGAAYALDKGTISLDLEYLAWSTFEIFAVDFADEATPDVEQPRRWHGTLAVRAGYEQRGLVEGLTLRGGAAWDPTPAPAETLSPTLPDGDRILVTLGAGYEIRAGLAVHIALGHVFFLGAEAKGTEAFPGSYEASANMVAVGLSLSRD